MESQSPGEVRLIGGVWKRSLLKVINRPGLRPTPNRVRETLFNWLGQDLTGWNVLDAFAGSGALGFEAASRGAQSVTLIEKDPAIIAYLQHNIQRFDAAARCHVHKDNAISWMTHCHHRFDLIFLDPPFGEALFDAALQSALNVLNPGGWIYLESDRPFDQYALPNTLRLHRQGQAGMVHFHLFQSTLSQL